jgi:tetratricopeptide (TPR) repeat protein
VTYHPTEEELDRFLARRLDPAAQARLVRHLLSGCDVCRRSLAVRQAYDSLQTRIPTAVLARDPSREEDRKLERALEALGASSADRSELGDSQGQSPPSRQRVESLLEQSFALRFNDSGAMRRLAFRALKVAENLHPEEYAPALICDVQALAWAELANALRVGEQYEEAGAAFRRARALVRRGSGEPRLFARLSWFEAVLCIDQRRLAPARELIDGAYSLYLKLGERHLAGRALISKGITLFHGGRLHQSRKVFQQALVLLDLDRDPQLLSIVQKCHIDSLVRTGEYGVAGKLLLKSDLRRVFADHPIVLLRIRWAEGILQAGLGKVETASRTLLEVRSQFLDRQHPVSAARVSLDLLPLWLRQGKHREMREVARQSYDTLRDLKIDREAAEAEPYLS